MLLACEYAYFQMRFAARLGRRYLLKFLIGLLGFFARECILPILIAMRGPVLQREV
jgi:hypothetical protein